MNKKSKEKKKKERKKKREERKAKRKEKRIEGGKIKWSDVSKFFKVLWKIIYAILRFGFAPFWYTGVLVVYIYRFLKERGDHALTDEDKKFLSLIPTLFFMLSLCISLIFVIVYFELVERLIQYIRDFGFWKAIGDFFVLIGIWIWIIIRTVFYDWIWVGIVENLANLLAGHVWIAAVLLLVTLIIVGGLGFLLFHAPFMQKTVRAIRNFFKYIGEIPKKIALFFVNIHRKIRGFVLDYLVGKKYIETKSKNFFWAVVLVQMTIAVGFTLTMLILGIVNYAVGAWTGANTLQFGVYVSLIDFVFIGIFSTWFFHKILGVSVKGTDRYAIKT